MLRASDTNETQIDSHSAQNRKAVSGDIKSALNYQPCNLESHLMRAAFAAFCTSPVLNSSTDTPRDIV
jgi:hypothetical protein